MEKDWRDLEILVEKIEKIIAPTGAIIKSPDYLLDNVTNEEREVDVSIRFDVGSSNILIAIECRNRNKVQDVRWIEEIKTKHADLGTSKVIAVSKTGFSQQAIKKANFYNIELRTFDDIDEKVINSWNKNLEVTITTLTYSLHALQFKFEEPIENVVPEIEWHKDPLKTIIVKTGEEEKSIESFVDQTKLFEYLKNSTSEQKVAFILLVNGKGKQQTNHGVLTVLELKIILLAKLERERISTSDITRYKDISNNKIHEIGIYNIQGFPEGDFLIQSYKKHDSFPTK